MVVFLGFIVVFLKKVMVYNGAITFFKNLSLTQKNKP